MAKTEKSKLEMAIEELRKAEQTYEKLIGQRRLEPSAELDKTCREALQAKREAQKIVQELQMGKKC